MNRNNKHRNRPKGAVYIRVKRQTKITVIDYMSQLIGAAITEYRRLGDLKNRNLLLTVLEPVKCKIKMLGYLLSDEGQLPGLQMDVVLLCSHVAESRAEGASSCVSF